MNPDIRLACATAMLLALALPAAPGQPPGTLDPSFGTGGIAVGLGPNSQITAIECQPDDKIVAAGRQDDQWAIARFMPDGTLDAGFGTGGVVLLFGTVANDYASDLAIDSAGRIVVVGWRITDGGRFTTVRLLSDGSLDPAFGNGGVAETEIGKGGASRAVLIQPDGKIVVGGYAYAKQSYAFAVARYDADGSLDTATFGDFKRKNIRKGYTLHDIDRKLHDVVNEGTMALQADGKILLGGYTGVFLQDSWTLARYNDDGSVDTGFGSDGAVIESFGDLGHLSLRGIAEEAGLIYTSGRCYDLVDPNFSFDAILVRHLSDGSLDTGFGVGGIARTFAQIEDQGAALLIQADGKILVSSSWAPSPQQVSIIVWRFDPTGTLDSTFGTGGRSDLVGTYAGNPLGFCFGQGSTELFVGGAWGAPSQFVIAKFFR
jgi:uncharacterized delta-60 repeat protein